MREKTNRRQVLATTGAVLGASIAGCTGSLMGESYSEDEVVEPYEDGLYDMKDAAEGAQNAIDYFYTDTQEAIRRFEEAQASAEDSVENMETAYDRADTSGYDEAAGMIESTLGVCESVERATRLGRQAAEAFDVNRRDKAEQKVDEMKHALYDIDEEDITSVEDVRNAIDE